MGIEYLWDLIKTYAPEAQTPFDPESWRGKRIAIDWIAYCYVWLTSKRERDFKMTELPSGSIEWKDDFENTLNHIECFVEHVAAMLSYGWKPIMVIEGMSPPQKKAEREKRLEDQKKARANFVKAQALGNYTDMLKYAKEAVSVSQRHKTDTIELCKLFGIPYVEAPYEAESQCAFLCREGLADAVLSEDSDVLALGAPILIRNVTVGSTLLYSQSRTKFVTTRPPLVVSLEKLLTALNLSHDEFIDMCLLLGCDYTAEYGGKIKGMGKKHAYDEIKKHRSLENVIVNLNPVKHPIPKEWTANNLAMFRNWFKSPPIKPLNEIKDTLVWSAVDKDVLRSWLTVTKKVNSSFVDRQLVKLN